MPRPISFSLTMAAADADAVCLSQTPAGAGNLTINGVLASGGVATLDVPRHVSITSAGNDSGRTFTVTGTNRYGATITEAITGPNTTTVKGVKNFKTVTQVAVDAATAGAITVGTANELESKWIPYNYKAKVVGITGNFTLSTGGALTYTIQHTLTNVQSSGFLESDANAFNDATLASKTASANGSMTAPVRASRVKITGYTSGTLTCELMQQGK